MLLALTLWVSSALPVAEVPRPGVVEKDAAVQVLLLDERGDVSIDPGGGKKRLPAVRGLLLLKSDRIVVGPGAWVALAILGNEHVVRLDDDLSLLVSELALLDAPRQSQSAVQQLDLLLTKKENERTERLIGWHASQTAANTQPVQKEKSEQKQKSDTGGGGMSKSRMNLEERAAKSMKDEEAPAPKPSAPPAQPASAPPSSPPPPPGSGQVPARKRAEPVPARGGVAGIDPELQACVDLAVAAWSEGVRSKLSGNLTVSAKLRESEVIVSLPLGLPPSPCFAVYFQKQGGLSASWTRVTVPLK